MPLSSISTNNTNKSAPSTTTLAAAAAASSSSSPSSALHPCLRIFGKCNFGSKCRFASLPANSCLSFLKGNCKSKKCKYPHVSSISDVNTATPTITKKTVCVPSPKDDSHDVEEKEINDLMMILCPDDNDDNDDTANPDHQVQVQVQQPKNTIKFQQHQNDLQDLKKRHELAQKALSLKHEGSLKIEKEKNAKTEQELKNTTDKLSHLQETTRLFQEQLPDLILSLTKAAQASSSSTTPSEKSIAEEIKALSEKIENQVLSSRRQPLLQKVFEIANAEFNKQKNQYLRGYSDLIPNDCLFSGHSEVAEKFFKACPDTIFAHELLASTTTTTNERGEKKESKLDELNTERFAISFHGTRGLVPAFAIEHGGLDPARRSGQALGPGEYSAPHISTASGYSAGTILAMLIYKPREEDAKHKSSNKNNGVKKFGPVNLHNNNIYVVENPTDKSCTYMLPLGTSFNYEYLKHQTFKRSCDCKEKMDKNNKNKDNNENNNNANYHYGKKFFFKEKNEKKSGEYEQMGEESCRVLLKALFEQKPKEQSKKNKKQKKNKNKNNNNNGYPICYVFTKEGELCSVDLNKFEMKHMKSGKVFSLGVWTPRE